MGQQKPHWNHLKAAGMQDHLLFLWLHGCLLGLTLLYVRLSETKFDLGVFIILTESKNHERIYSIRTVFVGNLKVY